MKGYVEFLKSLDQKYNAVCFDIDGTLTKRDSLHLDGEIISMIGDLLKRKIPIVFITGRGETGLNNLKKDLLEDLRKMYNASEVELSRMYILTNDGAKLYYTEKNEKNDIWNKDVLISTNEALGELNKYDSVINSIDDLDVRNITYSKDKNGILLNIRYIVDDSLEVENYYSILMDLLNNEGLDKLNITRGLFRGKNVLQVGASKKDRAIEIAELIIGVPKNSMIRIGDCGDEQGNDFSMLNCEQGYSVDKISNNPNACFPIVDENGKVLKGVEATKYLIKKAKILPTVCLESANKDIYSKEYAALEKTISSKNNELYYGLLKVVKDNFLLKGDFSELFDFESGSIMIPMCDWLLIDNNNSLKKLFDKNENDSLLYSIRDNNNYLLRGSRTYYYLLANRKSDDNNDYTSSENIYNWYINNISFIHDSLEAVKNTSDFSDVCNKKMILGILDNIRNVSLLLLNHNLVKDYNKENVLMDLSNTDNYTIRQFYFLNYLNANMMSKICFSKGYCPNKKDILDILMFASALVESDYSEFLKNFDEKDYSKEYRTYREIDNFSENYINLYLSLGHDSKDVNVCGMSYGGIELPIIYKTINPNVSGVNVLKFNKEVSGYRNKQLIELRKFDINKYNGIKISGEIGDGNIFLLDDNILSGKTIQLAINTLYDIGYDIAGVNIVRYPGVNRLDQMFMDNHSAVDYRLFFDYINGLCYPSPYSWRDNNDMDIYKDSLGIFDLNRRKIVECLVKNHDYSNDSEVAEYVSSRVAKTKQK